jgi:hypothetical protein
MFPIRHEMFTWINIVLLYMALIILFKALPMLLQKELLLFFPCSFLLSLPLPDLGFIFDPICISSVNAEGYVHHLAAHG